MPIKHETKLKIQARYAEEVRLRTAARIAEVNVACTHRRPITCSEKNITPLTSTKKDIKTAKSKLKKEQTTDRGRKILEETKRKMRLAQEARTRKRLEELDYAAYAALGDDQSMQIWVLQNEVVAEAKEPWSDNGTPQLNVSSTYGTTEEHNHDAS